MQFGGGRGGMVGRADGGRGEEESLIDHVGYRSQRELSKIAA